MDYSDLRKCFVFQDTEWSGSILKHAEMGLWTMVTDRDMSQVGFYVDRTMAWLLGLKEELEPEACFEFWYRRVNRGNYVYVNEAMRRMMDTDKLCEIQYTWNHPEWGDIPVRCAGRSRHMEDGRVLITGYHQNMDILDQMMRWPLHIGGEEIFEYNINTKTALIYTERKLTYGEERQLRDFPQCLVKTQVVHPQSRDAFLQAFRVLQEGGKTARCEARLKDQRGEYGWFSLDLEIMAYEHDIPGIVLGRIQDISRQKELEQAYVRSRRVNQLLLDDVLAYGDADLTEDKVMGASGKWREIREAAVGCSYSSFVQKMAEETVKPEHREEFSRTFDRNSLMQKYNDGECKVTLDYRRLMEHDMLRWVRVEFYMYRNHTGDHVRVFFCMKDIDRYKRMEHSLSEGRAACEASQEQMFERILWAAGEAACLIDPEQYAFITANQAFYRKVGMTEAECRGRACHEIIYGRSSPCTFCNRLLWERDQFSLWEDVDSKTGVRRLVKTKLVEWDAREALLVIGMDIPGEEKCLEFRPGQENGQRIAYKVISGIYAMTEAPDMEEAMSRLMDILAEYYEASHMRMFLKNKDSFAVKCICRMDQYGRTGVSRTLEHDMEEWLSHKRPSGVMDYVEPQDMLGESFEVFQGMEREQLANMSVFPIVSRKGLQGYIVMFERRSRQPLELMDMLVYFIAQEINRRQDSQRLYYSIYHDSLTGLLNRGSYDEYRRRYRADRVVSLGVIVVDINDLKSINDTKGTEQGDKIICSVSGIIRKHFSDHTVFRLNSNEFDIIIEDISLVEFEQMAGRLLQELEAQHQLSAAVGKIWDDREKNLDWAVKQAGELMRIDKQKYYENKPSFHGQGRMELIKELLSTIERGEFKAVLQPKLYLDTGKCAGAEALVRVKGKDGRDVPPSRFIGILERENLISYLDLFVMEECCRLLEQWKKAGYTEQILSFNFSRLTLLSERIVDSVESIVQKYDVRPEQLEIEVTESIGALGRNVVYQALREFGKRGYRICLDDFGTKYSNLDILSDVEFDVLKLDKSLVDKIGRDKVSQQIVKHVVAMCRDLKIQTVAEGVEETSQAQYLTRCRCDVGQGYLYGKPMEAEEFEKEFCGPKISNSD